jgi:hypothetical protein
MNYEEAKFCCHVRSAIFRKSKGIKHWYNSLIPLDDRISGHVQ